MPLLLFDHEETSKSDGVAGPNLCPPLLCRKAKFIVPAIANFSKGLWRVLFRARHMLGPPISLFLEVKRYAHDDFLSIRPTSDTYAMQAKSLRTTKHILCECEIDHIHKKKDK